MESYLINAPFLNTPVREKHDGKNCVNHLYFCTSIYASLRLTCWPVFCWQWQKDRGTVPTILGQHFSFL